MRNADKSTFLQRFENFELNCRTGELYRKGLKVKLQGQPIQLLMMLLDRPGEIVTRDEMRAQLWPKDTFVDFEHSLNSAIKKLRAALRDSAAEPRFVETLTRQGYRFIAPVEDIAPTPPAPVRSAPPSPAQLPSVENGAPQAIPPPQVISPAEPLKTASVWKRRAAILVFIAAAALLIVLSRWPFSRHATSSDLTLLLSGKGDLLSPSISPDGAMLAYVKTAGGSHAIQVRRITGGQPVTLFHDPAREAEPAFSPDGERIAFTRYLAPSGQPQICVGPALGGEFFTVAEGARNPAWSPDGKQLAFIFERPGRPQELATATIDGTDVRSVLTADSTYPFLHYPSWSPDGRTLAVERSMGGVSGEIWLLSSQSGAARRLRTVRPNMFLHHPVFTPDGKGLIYSSNRSGATNLWYRSLRDGSSIQLTRGPGPEAWPSVSRGGRVVFMESTSEDRLYVSRLDHPNPKALLSHSPFLWEPAFSPDGSRIAYSQGEYSGDWGIWSEPVTGGEPRRLTSGPTPQIYGHFSRDGRWLIYFTWSPGAGRVWRVPGKGGAAEPLTPPNEDASYGDLSPDGSKLAYTLRQGSIERVAVAPVGGGAEHLLTVTRSTVGRWSPDGQWITYSPDRSYANGVFIAHPDGTNTRRLTSTGGWPTWFPDGKRIAFRTIRNDGTQQVNFVRLQDGKISTLAGFNFAGNNDPMDFSGDGKVMAYTNTVTFSSEIWLLETRQ